MTDAVQPKTDPFAAFAHRDFRLFQAARFLSTIGWQMQSVAVGWQVYGITNRKISLGYIGLFQFLPFAALSLVTGHTADRFDRRRIMLWCETAFIVTSLALAAFSFSGSHSVATIYVLMAVVGTAHAFAGPASQSLMPQLVPPEHFQNAVAWNSSAWQMACVVGPALGGLVYATTNSPGAVYLLDMVLTACCLGCTLALHIRTGRMEKAAASWATVLAGVHYVWERKIILGTISLDLFAVLFGGAVALLPAYAKDVLHSGPIALGIMRSSPAIGAAITAIILAHLPPMKRAGATMLWCVAVFGAATIVFGLSKNLYLAVACLFVLGVSDMVSVFVRHTLVQVMTPPAMRGRVSAVNLVFIGASNELGEFESGLTGELFGTVPAIVLGGIGTLIVVALWAGLFPDLRRFTRLDSPMEPMGAIDEVEDKSVKL